MTESKCSICWEIKKRPALQPVTDTIEALIREHVYSGYSRQIEAYSDKICGNCKNNLYKVHKNKTVPSCWLDSVKKVFQIYLSGVINLSKNQSIVVFIVINEHTACKYM